MDRDVLAVEEQLKGRWESFVVRPWRVVDEVPSFSNTNSWLYRKELAAAMVDSAINGGEPRLLDNATLRAKGQAALKKDQS